MSYILDALKKSEQERSLGEAPSLGSNHHLLHSQKNGRTHIYLLFLSILFIALIAGLAVYFYQVHQTTQTQLNETKASMEAIQSQSAQKGTSQPEKIVNIPPESQSENSDELEEELEIIRPSRERQQALQKEIQIQDEKDRQVKEKYQDYFDAKEKALQKLVQEETIEPIADAENQETHEENWRSIPTIYDLDSAIRSRIPKLEVTTHIYSSAAAYRRATINDKTAKEGSMIETGLVLERITEDGVVFLLEGERFRMNAIDKWPN